MAGCVHSEVHCRRVWEHACSPRKSLKFRPLSMLLLVKTTNSETIRRKYCHFRNMAVSAVRKAKHSFLMSMSSLIRSPKQFWSAYHSLMPNRERIPHTLTYGTISAESPTAKANLLNSYFSSCFSIPPSQTSMLSPLTPP